MKNPASLVIVIGLLQSAIVFGQCTPLSANAKLPQIINAVNCLMTSGPITAQWPTAAEVGKTPPNTASHQLKDSKDFGNPPTSLKYNPSFALVSIISIRDAGDAGSRDTNEYVIVPQGRSAKANTCSMTITLQKTTMLLDGAQCLSFKGGYPAMNITFLP